MKNWLLLMDDLEAISVDNDFTAEVKAKAKGIMGELKGKNTLVLFHFLIDIVQELAKWSKQLQKRAGTLIRLEQYRTRMLESLRALKTHHGTYLAGYLSVDLVCSSVTGRRKISLQQYYSSESVKQHAKELLDDKDKVPQLDTIRSWTNCWSL